MADKAWVVASNGYSKVEYLFQICIHSPIDKYCIVPIEEASFWAYTGDRMSAVVVVELN